MEELLAVTQADDGPVEMVLATEGGVESCWFDVGLAFAVPTTGPERDAIYHLAEWLRGEEPARWWGMEIAFLQFDMNPGSEAFTADEIRDLRTLLAEQRGTERWSPMLASLLAKFEAAEQGPGRGYS